MTKRQQRVFREIEAVLIKNKAALFGSAQLVPLKDNEYAALQAEKTRTGFWLIGKKATR